MRLKESPRLEISTVPPGEPLVVPPVAALLMAFCIAVVFVVTPSPTAP